VEAGDAGYIEVDGRLRLALPDLVRQDEGGRPRPGAGILRDCGAARAGGTPDLLAILDDAIPPPLCVVHAGGGDAGGGPFLRVYVDPAAAPEALVAHLERRLPQAARRGGAVASAIDPLAGAEASWRGLRARLQVAEGESRRGAELDVIVIPRAGGGAFVVATSAFDVTRLEISQRPPARGAASP
jgi:hypothetical protein